MKPNAIVLVLLILGPFLLASCGANPSPTPVTMANPVSATAETMQPTVSLQISAAPTETREATKTSSPLPPTATTPPTYTPTATATAISRAATITPVTEPAAMEWVRNLDLSAYSKEDAEFLRGWLSEYVILLNKHRNESLPKSYMLSLGDTLQSTGVTPQEIQALNRIALTRFLDFPDIYKNKLIFTSPSKQSPCPGIACFNPIAKDKKVLVVLDIPNTPITFVKRTNVAKEFWSGIFSLTSYDKPDEMALAGKFNNILALRGIQEGIGFGELYAIYAAELRMAQDGKPLSPESAHIIQIGAKLGTKYVDPATYIDNQYGPLAQLAAFGGFVYELQGNTIKPPHLSDDTYNQLISELREQQKLLANIKGF